MSIRLPQNPGIGGLDELTSAEEALIQSLAALADPNADRILFWDDSAGAFAYLTIGSGLSITDTTLTATGTIDGSGSAGTVAFWSDADTLTYDAHFTYDSTNDILHIHKLAGDATDGLIIESANGTDIGILGAGNTANVTWYGSHNFDTATQDTIAAFTGAGKTLGSLALATYPSLTELSYVKGVTSAIQTQLNAKQASDATLTALAALADGSGVLTNDGAGNLSWGAAGSGANTALSNLASVAINTTLVSDTDNTDSLGTLAIAWSDLFLGNGAVINFTSSAGVSDVTLTHSSNTLTLGGGNLALGTNSLTMTGSIAATGARVTKGWFTDIESTNEPTINGIALSSATLTFSNKTLTAPKFADLGFIADANGNELLIFDTVTSAVNEITFANAATGNNPNFTASGGDANVGIDVNLKGTGTFNIKGNATQAAELRLYEDTDDGSNYASFKVPALAANTTYTLPSNDGDSGQFLQTNGSGTLSWATSSGTPTSAVRTYLSAAQTVATGFASRETVEFNTESYDVDGEFNTGTYTFTPAATGKYLITVNLQWASWSANTGCEIYFVVAGVESLVKTIDYQGTGAWCINYSDVISLTATSGTFKVVVAQYTGGNRNLTNGEYGTNLSIKRLS